MTAQELTRTIESRLEELAGRVDEAKSSDEVLQYLKFISAFHQYSLSNVMSIFFHSPAATHVAGFHTWLKLGRYVRKGEKGIPIFAPCTARKDEDGGPKVVTFFKIVFVFDVSQTDGKPLPEAPTTATQGQGVGETLLPLVEQLARQRSIKVEYVHLEGNHQGTSYGGRVEVSDALDSGGKASVLLHELAHEALHKGDEARAISRQQREVEAETVSYILASYFGLESKASANYLALWDSDKGGVMSSFKAIHKVAAEAIRAIEKMRGDDDIEESA